MCDSATASDPKTSECLVSAQQDAAAELALCSDPPECLAPGMASLIAQADAGIGGMDPVIYCGIPTACGDVFGQQCDGACPAGEACEQVSGQCVCVAAALGCGVDAGAPACWGTCPPERPICHGEDGGCLCVNY